MSDAEIIQPPATDIRKDTGNGRHRGPVSTGDQQATPQGRHRKPSDQQAPGKAA